MLRSRNYVSRTEPPPRGEAHAGVLAEFDSEHQELFSLARQLRKVLLEQGTAGRAQPLCGAFALQVTAHFAHERRLMRAIEYPLLDWHNNQHAAARGKLRNLKRQVRLGDAGQARDEVVAIERWLENHIHLSDRMLSASIRNHYRAQSL